MRLSFAVLRSIAVRGATDAALFQIMAVNFYKNVQVLIQDFQRRGLHPEVIATSGGEPPRAVQIRLADELMVHWDADSRSVWAEGPWPEVQRIEAYIRRRFSGGVRRKLRKPRTLARVVGLCIVLALIFGVCVPLLRKRPVVLSPTTPAAAESTKDPANAAGGTSAASGTTGSSAEGGSERPAATSSSSAETPDSSTEELSSTRPPSAHDSRTR